MAAETYKWYRPDTILRPEYGGGAARTSGDAREASLTTLNHRWLSKGLGYPSGGTRYLFEMGVATDTNVWIRVPDLHYSAISGRLSANELATVVSVMPAGWVRGSLSVIGQPHPLKKSIIFREDSLGFGLGTTTGDTRDVWITQLINSIAGNTLKWNDTSYTEGLSEDYYLFNMSLGGSSWGNTNPANSQEVDYPFREDLAFQQRTKTLSLNGNTLFIYRLTNDLPYDATISPEDLWANRIIPRLNEFRAEFGANQKIGFETHPKRSENATLNGRINTLNGLWRNNFDKIGFNRAYLFDSEAKVSYINIATGNTADTTYYTDGTHYRTVVHAAIAAANKNDVVAAMAAA